MKKEKVQATVDQDPPLRSGIHSYIGLALFIEGNCFSEKLTNIKSNSVRKEVAGEKNASYCGARTAFRGWSLYLKHF